ncbi:MAG TPA: hypothetical protein VLT15_11335, partial [Acidimicrobiia bacterium]|nr:hypothetical protein [Acidimicrobiia bacterium]
MSNRPIALLSAISMVASLLITAPLPAAATSHEVVVKVTTATGLKTEIAGDADVIVIDSSEQPILIDLAQPITVGRDVTIRGAASTAEATTLKVTGNSPALIITSGNVTLERFAITGANDRKASGGAVSVHAGATLTMREMSVYKNFAGEGGGLYNAGTTHIEDSVFYANESFGKGGAINNAGELRVSNSTFASNDAGQGGAISSSGMAELRFVTIVGNSSKNKIGAG